MAGEPLRRLILLRHGRTAWNHTGHAQGHADVGLDDVGRAQAAEVAPYVAALGPVSLRSSDLARARETSAYVERATGLTATLDERLREFDVGARQGTTFAEFERRWPAEFAAWATGAEQPHVPGAETAVQVRTRMLPALQEHLDELAPGETGVVVTHGAALKVGLVGLLGWPTEQAADLRGVDNGAWVSVVAAPAGRARLDGYHLRADRAGGGPTER